MTVTEFSESADPQATPQATPQAVPAASPGSISLLRLTHLAYGLFAIGVITAGAFGIATLASVVLIYLKRADVAGTIYGSHFEGLLKTFWWMILWLVLSLITLPILIGWAGLLATTLWVLYRLIKNWLQLCNQQALQA